MFPEEILREIYKYLGIKCRVCNRCMCIKDDNFFKDKSINKYYCSNECYNFC